MRRHRTMYSGHHRFRLATNLIARQPLVVHVAMHQPLLQVCGLSGPLAEALQRRGVESKLRSVRLLEGSLLPIRLAFRPPLIELAEGESDVAPEQAEFNEPIEARLQQKQEGTSTEAQPEESAKRSRGRIEEHLSETGSTPAPPVNPTQRNDQATKVLEKSTLNAATMSEEEIAAENLFAPRDIERSPQAWLARLRETTSATRDESNATPPVTVPLTQQTRRFLQPLVGIDPASVRIHRDAIGEQLTEVYRADALTIGDDIVLAAGHQDDTPNTLGLLAHELTHVARQRDPRFIPPIVRSMRPLPLGASWSSSLDEETLALHVEHHVERTAQEQIDQVAPLPVGAAGDTDVAPTKTTDTTRVPRTVNDAWGGLPAPWEPLPDWLVSSPATGEGNTNVPVVPLQPLPVAHSTGRMDSVMDETHGGHDTGNPPDNAGVHRAGKERSLDEEERQATTARPGAVKAPEPNLDELARRVYSLLKRRLGVEYRREN